jgi:hypothetical protein
MSRRGPNLFAAQGAAGVAQKTEIRSRNTHRARDRPCTDTAPSGRSRTSDSLMRARAVICVGVACFVVWIALSLPPGWCDDGYRRSRSNPAAIQRQCSGPPPWGESGAQAVRADTEVRGVGVRRRQRSARLGAEKLMRGSTSGVLMAKGGRTTGATLGELGAHRFDRHRRGSRPGRCLRCEVRATTRDAAPEAAFVVADGCGSYLWPSWSGRSPACKFP